LGGVMWAGFYETKSFPVSAIRRSYGFMLVPVSLLGNSELLVLGYFQ
jgi:hypothetical protein